MPKAANKDMIRNTNGPYDRWDYPEKDDNLQNLIENWDRYRNSIIVFLGAGASAGALNVRGTDLPTAYDLRNVIWREFMLTQKEKDNYDYKELGLVTLEHASTLAEAKSNIKSVKKFVSDYFLVDKPLWHHTVLPYLNPLAILTTNYDNLIEMGWNVQTGKPLKDTPQVKIKQLRPIYRSGEKLDDHFTPLYKPHGTCEFWDNPVGQGGLVLTQFDYFDMLNERSKMIESFLEKFAESCVIFAGYGFNDVDIASQLFSIRKKEQGPTWYTIFPRDNPDVRRMYQNKYGILQITRSLNDFLIDLDDAVNFIPEEFKFSNLDKMADLSLILPRNSK